MKMTVRELITRLEELAEDLGGHTEVRLATQPNYPFQHHLGTVTATEGVAVGDLDDDGVPATEDDAVPAIIYIGEGGQVYDAPYLPGDAAEALGWRR